MDKKNWLDKFQDKLKERKNNFSTSRSEERRVGKECER